MSSPVQREIGEIQEISDRRSNSWGDAYLVLGDLLSVLYPTGVCVSGKMPCVRHNLVCTMLTKLVRYIKKPDDPDSLRDLAVYALMLNATHQDEDRK